MRCGSRSACCHDAGQIGRPVREQAVGTRKRPRCANHAIGEPHDSAPERVIQGNVTIELICAARIVDVLFHLISSVGYIGDVTGRSPIVLSP
jgi:hypothetical protein